VAQVAQVSSPSSAVPHRRRTMLSSSLSSDSPDAAAGPSSFMPVELDSFTPPCQAGHHASSHDRLNVDIVSQASSRSLVARSSSEAELTQTVMPQQQEQQEFPCQAQDEQQDRRIPGMSWSASWAELRTKTATRNLTAACAATSDDSPAVLNRPEEALDPSGEIYSSLLSVAFTHQASLLFQGTPSRSSSFIQSPIEVSFRVRQASLMSRMCGYMSRRRDGPRLHDALLTCNIMKKSRHLRIWRTRFAVLTPHTVWTLEAENSTNVTDYIDLAHIKCVKLRSNMLTLHSANRNLSLQFAESAQALRWAQTLALKSQEQRGSAVQLSTR